MTEIDKHIEHILHDKNIDNDELNSIHLINASISNINIIEMAKTKSLECNQKGVTPNYVTFSPDRTRNTTKCVREIPHGRK